MTTLSDNIITNSKQSTASHTSNTKGVITSNNDALNELDELDESVESGESVDSVTSDKSVSEKNTMKLINKLREYVQQTKKINMVELKICAKARLNEVTIKMLQETLDTTLSDYYDIMNNLYTDIDNVNF
jgi:hypothetical protein